MRELPVAGRVEHVLSKASKVHPQIRDEFESAYCVFWTKVPYSVGAFGTGRGGARLAQLSKPDRRVYPGCAAVSQMPSWMEGAVAAAWRTVEGLDERVMRT